MRFHRHSDRSLLPGEIALVASPVLPFIPVLRCSPTLAWWDDVQIQEVSFPLVFDHDYTNNLMSPPAHGQQLLIGFAADVDNYREFITLQFNSCITKPSFWRELFRTQKAIYPSSPLLDSDTTVIPAVTVATVKKDWKWGYCVQCQVELVPSMGDSKDTCSKCLRKI